MEVSRGGLGLFHWRGLFCFTFPGKEPECLQLPALSGRGLLLNLEIMTFFLFFFVFVNLFYYSLMFVLAEYFCLHFVAL